MISPLKANRSGLASLLEESMGPETRFRETASFVIEEAKMLVGVGKVTTENVFQALNLDIRTSQNTRKDIQQTQWAVGLSMICARALRD
jgi:hypothetical protein